MSTKIEYEKSRHLLLKAMAPNTKGDIKDFTWFRQLPAWLVWRNEKATQAINQFFDIQIHDGENLSKLI